MRRQERNKVEPLSFYEDKRKTASRDNSLSGRTVLMTGNKQVVIQQ